MKWVVWSHEHQGYWPFSRMGYVPRLVDAGQFTFEEAIAIVQQANLGMRGREPEETMMPVPEVFVDEGH